MTMIGHYRALPSSLSQEPKSLASIKTHGPFEDEEIRHIYFVLFHGRQAESQASETVQQMQHMGVKFLRSNAAKFISVPSALDQLERMGYPKDRKLAKTMCKHECIGQRLLLLCLF